MPNVGIKLYECPSSNNTVGTNTTAQNQPRATWPERTPPLMVFSPARRVVQYLPASNLGIPPLSTPDERMKRMMAAHRAFFEAMLAGGAADSAAAAPRGGALEFPARGGAESPELGLPNPRPQPPHTCSNSGLFLHACRNLSRLYMRSNIPKLHIIQ